MIDSEAFTYTSKNNSLRRFLGVTRAQRDTSMAAHSAGATAWWVQRDVFIKYGNPTAGAAPENEAWKSGMMNINSSNIKWHWDDVKGGDGAWHQVAAWSYTSIFEFNELYTSVRGTFGNPHTSIGIQVSDQGRGMWHIFNPCGWSNVQFSGTNEKMAINTNLWSGKVMAGLTSHTGIIPGREDSLGNYVVYDIPAPSTNNAWETWTLNTAVLTDTVRRVIGLWLRDLSGTGDSLYLDGTGAIALDIISSRRPTLTLNAEVEIYELTASLTNETTGDALKIQFDMKLNQTLEIDTAAKRVTYLANNTSQYQALEVVGLRRDWWPLKVGNNIIDFTDKNATTNGVEVKLLWQERSYG
jgi:hypothetical protein